MKLAWGDPLALAPDQITTGLANAMIPIDQEGEDAAASLERMRATSHAQNLKEARQHFSWSEIDR